MTVSKCVLVFATAFGALSAQTVSPSMIQALEWRNIGPFRGGRSVAATGVAGQPNVFYFGSVGGGIWKSTNAGLNWEPIFDSQPVASIGALEVAPSNAQIIYAGTGETDIRSDLAIGGGVYKSTDAGHTWTYSGLRETRQIGRILVNPTNPDIAFVAALGHAYAANEERGVFRTNDGGKSWTKVLFRDNHTGAVDLAFEAANPNVIYACFWNAHRPPWSQYGPVEGPGSSLWKSTDGGNSWKAVSGHGLPETQWGRSGIATARGRVYLLLDAGTGSGLYRSDDAGVTWTRSANDGRLTSRNWYFAGITADPNNPDTVYVPNVSLYRSTDGAKTFQVLKGAPGGDDYHYLWVDPTDSTRMICGSDQGAVISIDAGRTWSPWYNQSTAQMYHVAVDNQTPYWVYGSQQDSGTVALPSRTDWATISEYDRRVVGGAESGVIQPDPKDPDIFYVSNTYGSLSRFDRRTTESQNITPWPSGGFNANITTRKYRFPWTAPLVFSAADPNALYYGSQYVLKTTDGGLHWAEISPDLTVIPDKPDRGVVYSLAPSPLDAQLLWAGTDTGLIHYTRDGGKTWTNVTPPGLSAWSKVTHIEASHSNPAIAYAAIDRHRLDDYQPHVYRTRDFGKTWKTITAGIGEGAFLNAIREDPARPGLLFAATERGVYTSIDDGDHWQPLQLNLPVSSVRDIVVKNADLVIATHGRGFWILDDFTPLRAHTNTMLIPPATAVRVASPGFLGTPLPPEVPQAKNPPLGAFLDYVLPSPPPNLVTLEVRNNAGELIRRFTSADPEPPPSSRDRTLADVWLTSPRRLTAKAGHNRFVWDLRFGSADGPLVLPGSYTVTVTADAAKSEQPLKVVLDPRSRATSADLQAGYDFARRVMKELERTAKMPGATAAAARRDLASALSVTVSADRTPPDQAVQLAEAAIKALAQ
ncbi:MAG: hypothetical protein ABI693_07710 [Bryobacteraceae bacterium]